MVNSDKIVDLAKRRGFFWQSSLIYGGIAGFYDYAHLGFLLKSKWENLWREFFLGLDDNYYEIQPSILMPENVFKASGHLESFADPLAKCSKCGHEERADHILEDVLHETFEGTSTNDLLKLIEKHKIKCGICGSKITKVNQFNLMFPFHIGVGKNKIIGYPTPETAQGAYVNFKQMFEVTRRKLPLGLGIVGKAFRNEIAPRNVLIRMREFSQAELQIFFDSDDIEKHPKFKEVQNYKLRLLPVKKRKSGKIEEVACKDVKLPKFYVYHLAKIQKFYLDVLGFSKNVFRFKELNDEEKAFYNKYHWDIELNLEGVGGWKEVGGLHYRTDHDLSGHQKISKQKQEINIKGKKFIPHVLELSFGVDRNIYALLELNYKEEKDRIYLSFPPNLAPYQAVVLPLVKRDGLQEKAREVYQLLKDEEIEARYDEEYIGKAYYRQDEIGTVFCITYDYDSLKDKTVTVRFRDNKKQIRVKIKDLASILKKLLNKEINFEKAGKLV